MEDVNTYVKREYSKPDLGHFTLEEYMEKVLIYGYLVVRYITTALVKSFAKEWWSCLLLK